MRLLVEIEPRELSGLVRIARLYNVPENELVRRLVMEAIQCIPVQIVEVEVGDDTRQED